MKLSAVIIAFNEEKNLPACLESLSFCDEIIVVDSNSTDRTAEIAKAAGAKVIQREWPGHIEQKNFALEQASGDWVLSLDADERVSPELKEQILTALKSANGYQGFSVPRLSNYFGRWIKHSGWYPDRKLRLVKRGTGKWGGSNPHDRLEVPGEVKALDGDLLHYPYKDLSDHLRKIDSYTTIMAREKHKAGKRALPRLLVAAPAKFLKAYVLKAGFLDGWQGFVLAVLGSYYEFLKYAKLYELERNERRAP